MQLLQKRIVNIIAQSLQQKDKHREIVDEAKAQAGEHANQVDWETGQVKVKISGYER